MNRTDTDRHTPPPIQFTVNDFTNDGRSITYTLINGVYAYQVSGDEQVFTPYRTHPKAAAAARKRYNVPAFGRSANFAKFR